PAFGRESVLVHSTQIRLPAWHKAAEVRDGPTTDPAARPLPHARPSSVHSTEPAQYGATTHGHPARLFLTFPTAQQSAQCCRMSMLRRFRIVPVPPICP